MTLGLVPIGLKAAGSFVGRLHRHHGEPRGHKFSVGVEDDGRLCGVAIIGRPVARGYDNGLICELTRLCTDGTRNACSFLYGAGARAAKEMGYRKIITYILESESGESLRGAGWVNEGPAGGGSWSCSSRPRDDKHPLERKIRWSRQLRGGEVPLVSDPLLWFAIAV